MKHDPADFPRNMPDTADEHMSDAALSAFLATIPPCPGLPSTPEEIEASDARARADIAAGRCIPHEDVAEWLETWGTPDFKPMPRKWLA